jgi:hypothetical protein
MALVLRFRATSSGYKLKAHEIQLDRPTPILNLGMSQLTSALAIINASFVQTIKGELFIWRDRPAISVSRRHHHISQPKFVLGSPRWQFDYITDF